MVDRGKTRERAKRAGAIPKRDGAPACDGGEDPDSDLSSKRRKLAGRDGGWGEHVCKLKLADDLTSRYQVDFAQCWANGG
jgi:hypothetical protein